MENISKYLSKCKDKLLDLSGRNRLINSQFSTRSLERFRIIDEVPDQLYQNLINGKTMKFVSLPPKPKNPRDEETNEFKRELEKFKLIDEEYLEETKRIEEEEIEDLNQSWENADRKLRNKVREELNLKDLEGIEFNIKKHAEKEDINPDYNLPKLSSEKKKHLDKKIQTLMLPDVLPKYLRMIDRKYKSCMKESGTNPLYLCFGFLKWKKTKSSDRFNLSPLLMIQTDLLLEKKSYSIKTSEEFLSNNVSLSEVLKKDFDFNIPSFNEHRDSKNSIYSKDESESKKEAKDLIESYFTKIEKAIKECNSEWQVERQISFGIYHTEQAYMWKDIKKLMTSIEEGNQFPMLNKLLSNEHSNQNYETIADEKWDDYQFQEKVGTLVLDHDSSQFAAIYEALNGKNLLIQGPPGTGKSQTIANIISVLIRDNKKVLFVAQKQAALDVVRNKLKAVGLSEYILEVFSTKANKRAIIESIKSSLIFTPPANNITLLREQYSKQDLREYLNEYVDLMGEKFGKTNKTINDILWEKRKPPLNEKISNELKKYIPNPTEVDEFLIKSWKDDLSFLQDEYYKVFKKDEFNSDPIRRIKQIPESPIERNKLKKDISLKLEKLKNLSEIENKLSSNNLFLRKIDFKYLFNLTFAKNWYELNKKTSETSKKQLFQVILDFDKSIILEKCLKEKKNINKEKVQLIKNDEFIKKSFQKSKLKTNIETIELHKKVLKKSNIFSYLFSKKYCQSRIFFINMLAFSHKKIKRSEWSSCLDKLINWNKTHNKNLNKVEVRENINMENYKKIFKSNEKLIYFWDSFSNEDVFNWINLCKEVPNDLRQKLLNKTEFIIDYFELENKYKEIAFQIKNIFDFFWALCDVEAKEWYLELKNFQNILEKIDVDPEKLENYFEFTRLINNYDNKILKNFFINYSQLKLPIKDIFQNFKALVIDEQIKIITEQHDNFRRFPSAIIEEKIKKFQRLENEGKKEIQILFQNLIHNNKSLYRGKGGKINEKTEMALLEYIINKSRTSVTIRDIFDRAKESLFSIKPCHLMSPSSVSKFLPLKVNYDVVIIDEASQMLPENALCALIRGKQMIIVGDQQQLPPSLFYKQKNLDYEEEDSTESILEMAASNVNFLTKLSLSWHYRSRHESLIKFSNKQFYENKLKIPMNSDEKLPNKGILLRYIEDAFYQASSKNTKGGINEREADELIKEFIKVIKIRPNESIGIATMNLKQKTHIENELRFLREENAEVDKYINKWEKKEEGINNLFVKNLENVQGDERDIIFISTVYGKDKVSNKVFQRFGPINGINGHRRLNVLFTRAKNQIFLFTSLKSEDIRITPNSKRGIKIFKAYLNYAHNGNNIYVEDNAENKIYQDKNLIESPFQEWAINVIKSLPGFDCDWEVGQSGYRIDIAVKHKNYEGHILAVETDGANYHSLSYVRDRDYLRQNILESYGWTFYRIWGTDWWNNPQRTTERLKERLYKRLEEIPQKKI